MVFQFFKSSYTKVKSALSRTRTRFFDKLQTLFQRPIDEETLDQIQRVLYEADFGVKTAQELTAKVRELHRSSPSAQQQDYLHLLKKELAAILNQSSAALASIEKEQEPFVILIVGVNGNGKTTSLAKLAYLFKNNGKKVLVGAADTFRAAAIEQLETWAKRIEVENVKGQANSDPAAVAFDAVQAGKARGCEIVLIDTAGRLHNKAPLMQELAKIKRSCQKASGSGPHETLLVLDATTGQNAIEQAKQFHQVTPITGLILTKLDGTAKGGIVVAIARELAIPVKFIGTGEGVEDLQPFDHEQFIQGLLEPA